MVHHSIPGFLHSQSGLDLDALNDPVLVGHHITWFIHRHHFRRLLSSVGQNLSLTSVDVHRHKRKIVAVGHHIAAHFLAVHLVFPHAGAQTGFLGQTQGLRLERVVAAGHIHHP